MNEFNKMIFSFNNTGYKKLKINNDFNILIKNHNIYIEDKK
jgi:hypothetical protein